MFHVFLKVYPVILFSRPSYLGKTFLLQNLIMDNTISYVSLEDNFTLSKKQKN